jgi:hypothetical protein
MSHFAFAYCCDAGQGGDNTLPNCTHSKTLGTLFMLLAIKTRAVFARRGNRFGELYVSINDSVYVPCLQIRLAQFDSGSRLQGFILIYQALSSRELGAFLLFSH